MNSTALENKSNVRTINYHSEKISILLYQKSVLTSITLNTSTPATLRFNSFSELSTDKYIRDRCKKCDLHFLWNSKEYKSTGKFLKI